MIASDKQVGVLIKQTTTAANWSVFYSFFLVWVDPVLIFFGRPDGKLFLTGVPILPCVEVPDDVSIHCTVLVSRLVPPPQSGDN